MAVKYVKLITGEDVIADVTETEQGLQLKNATKFIMTEQGLGLMPYAPFSKTNTFVVRNEHIICSSEVDDEIYNAYNSRYGSGLVVAHGSGMLKGIRSGE